MRLRINGPPKVDIGRDAHDVTAYVSILSRYS